MENIIIFNNSSKITKFLGVIFLIFCAFCWYGILSNQEMDALARTITISIALWATLFSLHNILYIDSFSFKKVSKSLCNTKGYFFAHREYTYSSINVKSIELRLASFLVNVNDEG
ncbi:hypothetical protein H5202_21305 [Shewanella sp. SG41-4]|uniref:hypothetical protein n=1 Tax=Shewanella sp. SG41-4 TaxID=2760976 RepID=UPI0015FFE8FB|nr:hypothetical protein [Shewanella sp. SG41-4]MBB1441134.1 hypothetical protein [Shewanella sp. SG41-4]